jgi:hypothetical protein
MGALRFGDLGPLVRAAVWRVSGLDSQGAPDDHRMVVGECWRSCRLLDAVYDYHNVYEAVISIIEGSRTVSKRENGSYSNRILNDAQYASVDLLSK